jgi:hypothetical protein
MVEEDLQPPALYADDREALDTVGRLEVDYPLG